MLRDGKERGVILMYGLAGSLRSGGEDFFATGLELRGSQVQGAGQTLNSIVERVTVKSAGRRDHNGTDGRKCLLETSKFERGSNVAGGEGGTKRTNEVKKRDETILVVSRPINCLYLKSR